MAEKLKATKPSDAVPGWEWLLLNLDGVLLDFAHHISKAPVYPMTPLVREGKAARSAEAATSKGAISDWVFRAHIHRFDEHVTAVENQPVGEVTLPTMKLMEWYAIQKMGPNQALAHYHLGAIFIRVYDEEEIGWTGLLQPCFGSATLS